MLTGELWVAVKARTQEYYRDLDSMEKRTQSTSQRMTASMELYSRRARRALLFLGARFFGVMKVTADAEETVDKFFHVFKEQTNDATRWATQFSQSVGRSMTVVMDKMALFQDVFVPMGFARREARLMSQQMVELAYDVGSLKNIPVDVVAQKFMSGIVGMSRALFDLGINTSEFMVQQELERMGIDGTTRAITEKDKVLARINLIYRMTKDSHGDLIRTSGSLTNTTRAFMDMIRDLSIVFGKLFTPEIKNLIASLKAWAINMKQIISTHKEATVNIMKFIVGVLILTAILPKLIMLIKGLGILLVVAFSHPVIAATLLAVGAIGKLVHATIELNRAKRSTVQLQKEELDLLKDLKKGQKDLNDEQLMALRRKLALNTLRQKELKSDIYKRWGGEKAPLQYNPDTSKMTKEEKEDYDYFREKHGYHPTTGQKLKDTGDIEARKKANREVEKLQKEEAELRAQINVGLQKTAPELGGGGGATAESQGGQWMGIGEVWRGAVSAALKGKNTPEERTAKNTADMAKTAKESKVLLQEIANKQTATGLVF